MKDLNASLISVPSDAIGAGTPRPINAKNASVNIALGIENIVFVIICPKILGSISLNIMKKSFAPNVFDANTNSCSLSLSTCALAIRLIPIHPVIISENVIVSNPGFNTIINNVTITRLGIPFSISAKRCIALSIAPPKYPDISP